MNRPTEAQRMCSGSRELFPRFGNFGCTLGGTMGKGREPQSPVQQVHRAENQPGVGGDAGNNRLAHKARPARVRRRICGERHRHLLRRHMWQRAAADAAEAAGPVSARRASRGPGHPFCRMGGPRRLAETSPRCLAQQFEH
jgi:hypothetical protein